MSCRTATSGWSSRRLTSGLDRRNILDRGTGLRPTAERPETSRQMSPRTAEGTSNTSNEELKGTLQVKGCHKALSAGLASFWTFLMRAASAFWLRPTRLHRLPKSPQSKRILIFTTFYYYLLLVPEHGQHISEHFGVQLLLVNRK